ncbi:Asp23/Gls24 family envelope stress response protein [Streptomyces sp. 8N616]|uniref:Asp23/Gls24 family envelope stress response protein n=1 Tax=Streptomyces sp. 8N616 TaxID=3457414 RepID=UPI003FD24BA3
MIPARVVADIAARAAYEALTRQVGLPPARRGLAAPRSSAVVHDGSARLGLTLDLPYPVDIAGASRQMQRRIAERVAQLTGMRVSEVTLIVQRLVPAESLERGRVA